MARLLFTMIAVALLSGCNPASSDTSTSSSGGDNSSVAENSSVKDDTDAVDKDDAEADDDLVDHSNAQSVDGSDEESVQQACPDDTIVWVNTRSGVYHLPGERWYGATSEGKYMCKADADGEGDRETENGQ